MHETYLPFTEEELGQHFADVRSPREKDRYLHYYRASLKNHHTLKALASPTQAQITYGRQLEKDERFWVATALMSLYHAGEHRRGELFAQLMERSGVAAPDGLPPWRQVLDGPLDLYFEVSLPSPETYREWLHAHLPERVPVPYLREAAAKAGLRLEGATKVDAMLVAREFRAAVVFEAKVLSDVSTTIRYDLVRNQLARIVDVTLDKNERLMPPLDERDPRRTCTVLLTPRILHPDGPSEGGHRSRLYGWLMPAYREPGSKLLRQHLKHRDESQLAGVEQRLGWVTWEDVHEILPGACAWL